MNAAAAFESATWLRKFIVANADDAAQRARGIAHLEALFVAASESERMDCLEELVTRPDGTHGAVSLGYDHDSSEPRGDIEVYAGPHGGGQGWRGSGKTLRKAVDDVVRRTKRQKRRAS